MVILDTSSLIRFFTRDDREKASKVKQLLESEEKLFIPEVIYPELEYVLTKEYKQNRRKILEVLRFLIALPNHSAPKQVKTAVSIYEKSKLDMEDCLITSHSLRGNLASFDKQMLEIKNVKKYWKT